jgi:GTPase SAR1 family protein
MEEQQENEIKITVIGDSSVGKTSSILCFVRDEFPETHIPTLFDAY